MASNESMSTDPISVLKLYKSKDRKINVAEALKCLFCKSILILAIQTKCGCRYCKECIDEYIKGGKRKCLGGYEDCDEDVTSYIPDPATNRDISLQKVKCLYDPCNFEEKIRNISAHLESCQFREEICSLCQLPFIGNEKEKHLKDVCLMREEKCEHCHGTFKHKDLKGAHLNVDHSDLCSKYKAMCPYKCDVTVKVLVMEHRSQCINKPQECPFKNCRQVVAINKMRDHLQEKCFEHSVVLCQEVENLRSQVESLEVENKTLRSEVESLEGENKALRKDLDTIKDRFERRICDLESNTNRNDARAKEKSESVFRNGKYIWKIVNFSKLKESAMNGRNLSVLSDSFYTADFGYKMCLKIYPYGDGLGKGSHLSVFFVIMKGEYDDLQQWPFRNKVTLTILDDLMKSTNHSDTFKPDARSICYQKPEEELNIASGSPKFISFSDLNNYLKNDILYLQIAVLP